MPSAVLCDARRRRRRGVGGEPQVLDPLGRRRAQDRPDVEGRRHAVEEQGDPARRCAGASRGAAASGRCRRAGVLIGAATSQDPVAGPGRRRARSASPRRRASGRASRRRGACARRARRAPPAARRSSQCASSVVQRGLADADRRVRPDAGEADVVGHLVGRRDPHVRRARPLRRWRRRGPGPARSRRPPTPSPPAPGGRGRRRSARSRSRGRAGRRSRPASGRAPSSSRSFVPGSTPSGANTPRSVASVQRRGRAATSSTVAGATPPRARVEVVAVRRGGFGSTGATVAFALHARPTRSGSSATPCSSSGRRRSPTSTAPSCASSTTWCRRCTTPPASAWPRRRSACRSGSSSTTSRTATAPGPLNPVIAESDGEWAYEEGCLSVPGLSWEIVRPKAILLTGLRPRRQRGRDRGRRATPPAVPARARPPRRRPAPRAARRRHPQAGAADAPQPHARRRPPPPRRSTTTCSEPSRRMRLVYLGTPEMAVPPLRALVDAGHDVALVVSPCRRPPRAGGAATSAESPVKAAAARARPAGHRPRSTTSSPSTRRPSSASSSPSGASSSRTCSPPCRW